MAYRHLLLALLLCLPAQAVFAQDTVLSDSCDLKYVYPGTDKKDYLEFDSALRSALKSDDPTALALLVQFPLKVNRPEVGSFSINDPRTLQLHYNEIVTKSVRDAVLNQDTTQIWCRGWGVEYNDDHVQVNIEQVALGSKRDFRVTAISFLGGKIQELPKTMRNIDFLCLNQKYRIVVDADRDNSEASLRYRAWIKPHGETDKPDMEITGGTNESAGNHECAYGAWTFKKGNTQYAVSELGCGDGPKGATGSVEVSIGDKLVDRLWCY